MEEKSKVALAKCEEYKEENVLKSLSNLFNLLGGIELFAKKGDKILLKPNLLGDAAPEKSVTTHPVVIAAISQILKDFGAKIFLGDSPAIQPFGKVLKKTGMEDVIKKYEITTVQFKTPNTKHKEENQILKNITLAKEIEDFDSIFNMCKLKTHMLMHFTGAVKNMYGCMPGLIKSEIHLRVPDQVLFAHAVLDIYDTIRPQISIMDGIVGMEGPGPNNGTPKKIGVLLASKDGLALDSTALRIIGQDPMKVPTIFFGNQRKIGIVENSQIEILGENISNFIVNDFKMPKIERDFLPFPVFVNKWIRKNVTRSPKIKSNCTLCGQCQKICPANAISPNEGKRMNINLSKCIRCFCCMEVCPHHAIYSKEHALSQFFDFLKKNLNR